LKKFATLLPNNWLAETPETLAGEEAWQTVGGKGADF
jgi:DNA-nicking Smr family endonuclease